MRNSGLNQDIKPPFPFSAVTCPPFAAFRQVGSIGLYFEGYKYTVKYDFEEENLKFTQEEFKLPAIPSAVISSPEDDDAYCYIMSGKLRKCHLPNVRYSIVFIRFCIVGRKII